MSILQRGTTIVELTVATAIPVIMLTARCEPQDIAAASAPGISDYVTKPFDFTQLMDKVRAVVGDRKP